MSWDTDWSTGVSETITEIQTIASNQVTDEANIAILQSLVGVIASSASSSLSSVSKSAVDGKFCKLYAFGFTNGGTDISVDINGVGGVDFPASFSGGSNQPFILEVSFVWDSASGKMYFAPISPADTNARMTVSSTGSPSSLTFNLNGTSSVSRFELKYA